MNLNFSSYDEAYRLLFADYPDILKVEQTAQMLGVNRKQIYKLIKSGKLATLAHGKGFLITKISVISYVLSSTDCPVGA